MAELKPGWAARLAHRLYEPVVFHEGGRGHPRVFLSAADQLAYRRGYDRWPLQPEHGVGLQTPEAQGFFDREQEALFS